MQFEYYVINVDSNQRKTAPFNIFSNYRVNSSTEKAIKKYLRSPSKFEYTYIDNSKNIWFRCLLRRTVKHNSVGRTRKI